MDKEEPSLPSKKPSSFYWACVKDAFGKAWWLVGVVTIILPLLKGLVDENEQGWQNWKVVKFLHDYGDFDIPILLGLAICAWRLLKAPYDIFAREREAAKKLAKKLHEIEIERITLFWNSRQTREPILNFMYEPISCESQTCTALKPR